MIPLTESRVGTLAWEIRKKQQRLQTAEDISNRIPRDIRTFVNRREPAAKFFENNFVVDTAHQEGGGQLYHLVIMTPLQGKPEEDPTLNLFFLEMRETVMKAVSLVQTAAHTESLGRKSEEAADDFFKSKIFIEPSGIVAIDKRSLFSLIEQKSGQSKPVSLTTPGSPDLIRVPLDKPHPFLDPILGKTTIPLSDFYRKVLGQFSVDLTWIQSPAQRESVFSQSLNITHKVATAIQILYLEYLFDRTPEFSQYKDAQFETLRDAIRKGDKKTLRLALDFVSFFLKQQGTYPGDTITDQGERLMFDRIYSKLAKTHSKLVDDGDLTSQKFWNRFYAPEESLMDLPPHGFEGVIIHESADGTALYHQWIPFVEEGEFDTILRNSLVSYPPHLRQHFFDGISRREDKVGNVIATIHYSIQGSIIFFGAAPGVWGMSMFIGNPRDPRIRDIVSEDFTREHKKLIESYQADP